MPFQVLMAPLLFSLPEYDSLARDVAALAGCERGEVETRRFPDGERYQRIVTPVDGRDVIVLGGTVTDGATLCLYDLSSALVKYGAERLTLVIPYFGYSTMERAVRSGEVVTAKSRARLLSSIPVASRGNRALLVDLHSEGIPHYFEGGLTAFHVRATPVIVEAARRLGGGSFVVASTDAGRAKWVEALAGELGVDAAFVYKRRRGPEQTEVTAVNADVAERTIILYDDMVRTGGSLLNAARVYRAAGAKELHAIASHAVFPGASFTKVRDSGLFTSIVATDSHPRARELESQGLAVLSIAPLLAGWLKGD
jgi:ribose-phosphate pyrophosphokinase